MKKANFASTPARVAASQALLQVIEERRSLSDVLAESKNNASQKDAALIQELSFGVCRYYYSLITILPKLLQKPIRQRDRIVEVLLLTALYQLQHSTTPAHAIINETVEACDVVKMSFAKGLMNACLRRVLREPELLQSNDEIALAHPQWLIEKIREHWPDDATAIMQANNQRPPMTLRVDLNQQTRDEFISACEDATAHPIVASAVILAKPLSVNLIPGFNVGKVSVQDAASQLAAPLLKLEDQQTVLDACAAPGGKTLHILQSANALQVTALDVSATRLERVKENCQRADLAVKCVAADALQLSTWWDGEKFDRILLDAPCSALGVIRRHPDIKLLRNANDLKELIQIQQQLLQTLSGCLKPNGILVYSTCSILPEENHLQIAAFLAENPQWRDETPTIENTQWRQRVPHGLQILPGEANMDGFYYAVLKSI